MTVPARDIGSVKTVERLGLDDNVLEDFIDSMSNVQATVGVGRAIVQNKGGAPRTDFTNFFVQAHLLPLFQSLGFSLRQARFHGKSGTR